MPGEQRGNRAGIYVRLSQGGIGVEAQAKRCHELADRLGLIVVRVYPDDDRTAAKTSSRYRGRPGFAALLGDLRAGELDVVLAWHDDRLLRDGGDLEAYIAACGRAVRTLFVQSGELDVVTASGRMMARIRGAVAQGEVEHMMERLQVSVDDRRSAGARHGRRPFGFDRAPGMAGVPIKAGGQGALAQVPHEARAVGEAYAGILAGRGIYTIAKEWNEAGLRTPGSSVGGSHPWTPFSVRRVLLRALNAGLVESKGELVHGGDGQPVRARIDSPIVDETTWRAVRDILTDPGRKVSKGPKPQYLLTGVLVCGVCGSEAWRTTKSGYNGGKAPVTALYMCNGAEVRPGTADSRCHQSRDMAKLDAYVEQVVFERLRRPDAVAALTGPAVDVAALVTRRTALEAEMDSFAREPGVTPRQLAIVNAPRLAELASIDEQVTRALSGTGLEDFAGGQDPETVWAGLLIERRRAVVKRLLRVRLVPSRSVPKHDEWQPGDLNENAVEIIWQDA
jgi:DNA invertase Pin-like site-specific DNA recombinase